MDTVENAHEIPIKIKWVRSVHGKDRLFQMTCQ